MDLLTMLSTCSLAKDFGLVLAMAMAFSHGDRFTVRSVDDVGGDLSLYDPTQSDVEPRTKEMALEDMRRTKRAIVGLLPVPIAWAGMYQAAPADLLDACINISIATAQLSEYERDCAGRGRKARSCALHAYAQAAAIPLFEMTVLDTLREQDIPAAGPAVIETEAVYGSSIFAGTRAQPRTRGADRVFVHPSLEVAPEKSKAEKSAAPVRSRMPHKTPTTRGEKHAEPYLDDTARRELPAVGLPR